MNEETKSAVYVAWSTFKNSLDSLAQGIPNKIDRSTFPGLSGGVQSQLMAGFKFLGLTNDESKATADLHALAVTDEGRRKEKLKQILQVRYTDLFALDLTKTTPNELSEQMATSYNVSGDTREKAVRFFLSAVTYAGIPISRLFANQVGTSSGGTATRTRRRSTGRPKGDNGTLEEEETPRPQGTARQVQLKSGGTLTLTASIDIFQLTSDDRQFVFGLIDALEKYEKENPKTDAK